MRAQWGIGGWLLFSHLTRIGSDATQKLRERAANEISTTFASSFTREISLAEALDPETVRSYRRMATGDRREIFARAFEGIMQSRNADEPSS